MAKEAKKVKFGFQYKLLRSADNQEEYYQIEEVRAAHYRKIYSIQDKIEAKYKNEIENLKEKLEEANEKIEILKHSAAKANVNNADTTYFQETNVTDFTHVTRCESKRNMFVDETSDSIHIDEGNSLKQREEEHSNLGKPKTPNITIDDTFTEPNRRSLYEVKKIKTSNQTTVNETQFNFTITARTKEARNNIGNMFNGQDTTVVEDMELDNEADKDKDKTGQETESYTKFLQFQPHASSTRFISKGIVPNTQEQANTTANKENEFDIPTTTIFMSAKDAYPETDDKRSRARSEDERDAMKSTAVATTNNGVKEDTLTKMLERDLNSTTKWSATSTTKNVVFAAEKTTAESSQVTEITSIKTKRFNATTAHQSIGWDYDFMEIQKQALDDETQELTQSESDKAAKKMPTFDQHETLSNLTAPTLSNIILPNITLFGKTEKLPKLGEAEKENGPAELPVELEESAMDTKKQKLLTVKNLEASFNNDYYKVCFINQSMLNSTLMNQTLRNREPKNDQIAEETTMMEEDEQNKNNDDNKTINCDSICAYTIDGNYEGSNDDGSNTSSRQSVSFTTTTNVNLNETIMTAIREPFSFDVKDRLLNRGPINELKKMTNFVALKTKAPVIKEKAVVVLKDGFNYKVLKKIGEGAYAKIYLIQDSKKKTNSELALKVATNSTPWEFYITETIHERLLKLLEDKTMKVNVMDSFVRMSQFMRYDDCCFSSMNYYKNGTLLDLVNYHMHKGEQFPYWFVLYLTLEMLYIINYLHKTQIIHADIKADNLLIYKLPDCLDYFDQTRTKCIVLIDFNRSIDLNLLPNESEFSAKTDNKSLLCCEMKNNKTWTYQIDYYGILSSIHCVIFKKYMNTFNENGRNKITSSFPRNYDDIFHRLFDTYLNIPSCSELPDLQTEWINEFLILFKNELAASFSKSKPYLKELNNHFNSL